MDKVIVERPRHGSGWRRKGRDRPLEDEDGTPLRARGARAPRRPKAIKTKSLNENLAPLFRYLDAQVNRPWDKVWSEISENLRPTSTVQQHVRDHVPDHVAIDTRLENGVVMVTSKFGSPVPLDRSWTPLYVDPRTGILRRNPHWNARRRTARKVKEASAKERAARMRVLTPKVQLHRLKDETWWEVTLGPAPGERKAPVDPRWPNDRPSRPDIDAADAVLRAGLTDMTRAELYGMYGLMAVHKRQLSRREVKRRGLA